VCGAHDRADVPRVADTVQVDAERGRGPIRRSAVHTDHARTRAEGRDRVQQLGLDVLPGAQDELGVDPRRLREGDQVLALRHEQPLALAVLAIRKLADQLQLLVVLARDHKKRAPPGRPVKSRAAVFAQSATASRACSSNRRNV
jgi:hypothetical protein